MDVESGPNAERARLLELTSDWGEWSSVSLYLNRCRVDTPDGLVAATWAHVNLLRPRVGKVVDFGAGDARFARYGRFKEYVGYEIDRERCRNTVLPAHATLHNKCAFSDEIDDADVCIGNPPFVRNQDLPVGWRLRASELLRRRTGVSVWGLANAWQYFFLHSLVSTKPNGLCALVIPYEWVSRPSVKHLRDYIAKQKWNVSVYRLVDTTFDSVMTTSSITIVDKANIDGRWSYCEETANGEYSSLRSPSGSRRGVIRYLRRSEVRSGDPRAIRGLSPGTQKVLTLTEGERVRFGLKVGSDVVACVTTLRHIPSEVRSLTDKTFGTFFRSTGEKCWLVRTDKKPSTRLQAYLDAIPETDYRTATCLERQVWWKFTMPPIPKMLIATSFKGRRPKAVKNAIGASAVGGVAGIYNLNRTQVPYLTERLEKIDIRDRIVAHSNGLRKIEINQINSLLADIFP